MLVLGHPAVAIGVPLAPTAVILGGSPRSPCGRYWGSPCTLCGDHRGAQAPCGRYSGSLGTHCGDRGVPLGHSASRIGGPPCILCVIMRVPGHPEVGIGVPPGTCCGGRGGPPLLPTTEAACTGTPHSGREERAGFRGARFCTALLVLSGQPTAAVSLPHLLTQLKKVLYEAIFHD